MIGAFLFGIAGGLAAAYLALPYGWPAGLAYVVGGALCALIPLLHGWRQEVTKGQA